MVQYAYIYNTGIVWYLWQNNERKFS